MWFKVDDQFPTHWKIIALRSEHGNGPVGLWVLAGTWCAAQNMDGFIPEKVALSFGSQEQIDALVEATLWEIVPGGYGVHDWEQYQFTAEQIEAKKKANAERQKQWRDSHRGKDGKFTERPNALVTRYGGVSNALVTPPRPVPSRPDPTRNGYVDPSVLVSRRGREDGTDQFQGFYEQHHIDPGRVQSVWSQVFGEDITGMEIVALFQQLQMRAKATILDGTGYILATIRDQPGTCQNLLVKGAA